MIVFFVFKQKTAYEMRISDWSSDVCSSDLGKTVVTFNTNAGYGVGSSFETVQQLCADSKILEGFSTKGGVERDGSLFVMEGEKEKQVEVKVQNWQIGREP